MDYWSKVEKIYQEQGFIVFAWPKAVEHPGVGGLIKGGTVIDQDRLVLPQPFRQMTEATAEEYQRQSMALGGARLTESELAEGDFYRAVTE